jgi:predicted 2-oxoglutarate/Fe(II)-dependent dioxygenase YbiX
MTEIEINKKTVELIIADSTKETIVDLYELYDMALNTIRSNCDDNEEILELISFAHNEIHKRRNEFIIKQALI